MAVASTPVGSLRLQRQPAAGHTSLLAWDAADLQLLEAWRNEPGPGGPVLTINDSFGALALGVSRAISQLDPSPTSTVYSWGDSYLAHSATRRNAAANHLQLPQCLPASSPPCTPAGDRLGVNAVLWRLPKSLSLLTDQIQQLRRWLDPATPIWIGAMQKHVPQRAIALLERHLGAMQRQRLRGKAILWRTRIAAERPPPQHASAPLQLRDPPLLLHSGPGVFNSGRLDAGTELLLAQRQQWPAAGAAADLGCGNGVLALALAATQPAVRVWGFDESYQAVDSARVNAQHNGLAERTHFTATHLFGADADTTTDFDASPAATSAAAPESPLPAFDLILCNPPFHQQHTVTDHIARLMFLASKARLDREGELWIVGNRHLGYYQILKRLFGNCETMASDHRFVVLRSRNVRAGPVR